MQQHEPDAIEVFAPLSIPLCGTDHTWRVTRETRYLFLHTSPGRLDGKREWIKYERDEGSENMLKILVVDDDDAIREVLRLLLTEEGFQVKTARDGCEAIEILQHEGGWLILLDLMMPRLDGRAVLTYLRVHPSLLTCNKVILMSATTRGGQEYQALLAEVEAELPKPFDLDKVLSLVRSLAA